MNLQANLKPTMKTSITQAQFWSLKEVSDATDLQKKNPYNSEAHKRGFMEICKLMVIHNIPEKSRVLASDY